MIRKNKAFKHQPILTEFTESINRLYGRDIAQIILFGSRARGEAKEDADFDILVVTKNGGPELKNHITDLAFDMILKYGIDIEPVIFDQTEWNRLTHNPTSFAYCVLRDGKEL